jgi:FkbM family methyltransferase
MPLPTAVRSFARVLPGAVRRQAARSVALRRVLTALLPAGFLVLPHVEPGVLLRVGIREHQGYWLHGLSNNDAAFVRALRDRVRPGMTVFDIGANIGFYTVLLSRWVGDSGRVVAFEPDPWVAAWLKQNLELNAISNVDIEQVAVAAAESRSSFARDPASTRTGMLVSAEAGRREEPYAVRRFGGVSEVIQVSTITVDDYVRRTERVPDVIKIDVEGAELDVLRGMPSTLRRRPIVLLECSDHSTSGEVLRELGSRGYRALDASTLTELGDASSAAMVLAEPATEGSTGTV